MKTSITLMGLMVIGLVLMNPNLLVAKTIHVSAGESIQAAVNAADLGDTISVGPGEFAGAAISKRVKLRGSDAATVINVGVPAVGAFCTTCKVGFPIAGQNASGSSIEHFTFRDVEFGIEAVSTNDLTISHNNMGDKTLVMGIRFFGVNNSVISYNHFSDIQAHQNATDPGSNFGSHAIFTVVGGSNMIRHNVLDYEDVPRLSQFSPIIGNFIIGIQSQSSFNEMISQNKVTMGGTNVHSSLIALVIITGPFNTVEDRVTYNDFRGSTLDMLEIPGAPPTGVGPTAANFYFKNLTDGPFLSGDNRGEGAVNIPPDVNPSDLLPMGDELPPLP